MSTNEAPATLPTGTTSARVTAARRSTTVAFLGTGVVFASWVSRLPQIRSELQLSASDLGFVLLALAVGSLLALPAVAVLIPRFGTRLVVSAMAVVTGGALTLIAVGYRFGTAPVIAGLFLMGFGLAAWNVAMNVQGALVERHARRAIMSRFHAGFSVATVGGALLGAGLIAVGASVTVHLLAIAVVVVVTVALASRSFLADDEHPAAEPAAPARDSSGRRLDRRTVTIGIVVLAFAFAEGTGNDWIAVTLVEDHRTSAALASLGYAAFLAAMTIGRWTGPRLLARYGRVAAIRALAAVALVGLLLFVLSPWPALAFAGVLLWGLGACMGYPVALSAAADDSRYAAQRVSTVSGIGQLAFLGGPPLIGLLGSVWTIQHALIVVPLLITLALPAIGSLASPGTRSGRGETQEPTPASRVACSG